MALENRQEKFVYSFPNRDSSNRYTAHKKTTLTLLANGRRPQEWSEAHLNKLEQTSSFLIHVSN